MINAGCIIFFSCPEDLLWRGKSSSKMTEDEDRKELKIGPQYAHLNNYLNSRSKGRRMFALYSYCKYCNMY